MVTPHPKKKPKAEREKVVNRGVGKTYGLFIELGKQLVNERLNKLHRYILSTQLIDEDYVKL